MSILQSVEKIVKLFESSNCKYVVIGGIAILLLGGRASTIDFDLYVLADDFSVLEKHLVNHGAILTLKGDHQLRFTFDGVQVDVLEADSVLASLIFSRSTRHKIVLSECQVASPEDLIILKSLADRPIDRRDVEELRELFDGKLDETYIAATLAKYSLE
jgi:Nucleotidyl transferase of unknown function (DUF2204)